MLRHALVHVNYQFGRLLGRYCNCVHPPNETTARGETVDNGVDTAQMVRDALAFAGGINEADLTVTYGNGTVTLQGVVTSPRQRQEAEDIARNVPGVERVV